MGKVVECRGEEPGTEGLLCAVNVVPNALPDPCLACPPRPDRDDAGCRVLPEERVICWQRLRIVREVG
jgi:hypothetical protein